MSVPDLSALAESVFLAYPEDIRTLNALCDQCEADRAAFGEDDPRVQAGEVRANNVKGLFTRRIAWACAQQDSRFGLRKKTVGGIATRPSDGLTHATDVLMMQDDGQIIDVMSDRHSSWGVTPGDTQPLDQWVKPLPEGTALPVPIPVPVPPAPGPAPIDLSALIAHVATVESGQIALGILMSQLIEDVQQVLNRPDPPPPAVTFPTYTGTVFGIRVKLTPEGK